MVEMVLEDKKYIKEVAKADKKCMDNIQDKMIFEH